jgi:hypothetical protein
LWSLKATWKWLEKAIENRLEWHGNRAALKRLKFAFHFVFQTWLIKCLVAVLMWSRG